MYPLDDTIAAIASAPGGAARGIIRLSGLEAHDCLLRWFQADPPADFAPPADPVVVVGGLRVPGLASPLPCEVYAWPAGRSYTGEPVIEIHTLGSPPLLEAVLRALGAAGARPAQRGEFTLRAFLAGRIDLTQAEAVLGVVDAADAAQLHAALVQLAGGVAGPLGSLREHLLELLAYLEAGLDFAAEDLPFITPGQLQRQLTVAAEAVERLARQMDARTEAASQVCVVLVGRPNAGKSTLFNVLLDQPAALVSPHPGTTRDYLAAELDLEGLTCQLVDTAGRAGQPDSIPGSLDQLAEAFAAEQHRRADIRLLCLDSTRSADAWEAAQLAASDDATTIVVRTKADAAAASGTQARGRETVVTSAWTGEGIPELRKAIRRAVLEKTGAGGDVVLSTAVRCRHSVALAAECLGRAQELARDRHGEELIAAEIRLALDELGKVVGAVYTDDVLDRIFSRFCIGK